MGALHLLGSLLLVMVVLQTGHGQRMSTLQKNFGGGSRSASKGQSSLNLGFLAPRTTFGKRDYLRATNAAVAGLSKIRSQKFSFLNNYTFTASNIHFEMIQLTPSPTAILDILCKNFLKANVSAIMYMMNYETFGRSTASAQYFLQLAGYMGIPVSYWKCSYRHISDL